MPIKQSETKDILLNKITIENGGEWTLVQEEDRDIYTSPGGEVYDIRYQRKGLPAEVKTNNKKKGERGLVYFHGDRTECDGFVWTKNEQDRWIPNGRVEPLAPKSETKVISNIRLGKKECCKMVDVVERKVFVEGTQRTITGDVSAKKSNKLIYGRTQSGKTEETCESLVQRMYLDNCCGVYICRNYTAELVEQTENMCDRIGKITDNVVEVISVTGDKGWTDVIYSMKNNEHNKLYMIMGNSSVLKKILSSFEDGDHVRFTCALDEADIYVNPDKSKVNSDLRLFLSLAICKYFISATLLDVSSLIGADEIVTAIPTKFAFKDEVEGDDRVYRSLHKVIRYDVEKVGRTIDDAIFNGMECLNKAITYGWNVEYNKKGLPFTICHFHTETNADNAKIAKAVSVTKIQDVDIPVITFDQTGTKIYENGSIREFPKLKKAMQVLKDENKKLVYIMAGKMCSRAFRVVSEDWKMYISMMIYTMADSVDASLIVQRMGRMCGLTPKELICPQRIFVEKKIFYRAIDCTNATTAFVETAHANPEDAFVEMKKKIEIPKRMSKAKLSTFGVEKEFIVNKKKKSVHGDVVEKELVEENMSDGVNLECGNENTKINILKNKMKQYVKETGDNSWKTISSWKKITGDCGMKNYHARIDDTLSKLGFVEKRHTTARLEFRLNISY